MIQAFSVRFYPLLTNGGCRWRLGRAGILSYPSGYMTRYTRYRSGGDTTCKLLGFEVKTNKWGIGGPVRDLLQMWLIDN